MQKFLSVFSAFFNFCHFYPTQTDMYLQIQLPQTVRKPNLDSFRVTWFSRAKLIKKEFQGSDCAIVVQPEYLHIQQAIGAIDDDVDIGFERCLQCLLSLAFFDLRTCHDRNHGCLDLIGGMRMTLMRSCCDSGSRQDTESLRAAPRK